MEKAVNDDEDLPINEDIERLRLKSPELPPDYGRPGEWQLARKSLPVVGGTEHNYLALQFVPAASTAADDVEEIHGANLDREKTVTARDGTKVKGGYGTVAIGDGNDLVAINTRYGEHWGNAPTNKNVVLAKGSYDDIVANHWKSAKDKALEINREPVVYRFDEQNSNNFARNLIAHLGLEAQSGKWDGNYKDYGAFGFNYNPGQWNVRNVFDPDQRVTREKLRARSIRSLEERNTNREPVP